jgi:micrococcal nuclease
VGDAARFGKRRPALAAGQIGRAGAGAPERGAVRGFAGLVVFAFVVSALGFAWLLNGRDGAAAAVARTPVAQNFELCRGGESDNCVIDGDTFIYAGTRYRIADIDTPETRDSGCAAEKALGERATQRLAVLLSAGPFELGAYEREEDRYGRKLRIIRRGGESVGMMLVAEGLARAWDGRRHPWC